MTFRLSFAVAVVGLLSLTLSAASAAEFVLAGNALNDSDNGSAYTFIHTATSNAMTPPGGFTQYAGGTSFVIGDPDSSFQFTYNDANDSGAVDAGDTFAFDITMNVRDFTGSVTNPTVGGIIGELALDGTLEVTPNNPTPDVNTHGVFGSLDYTLTLTGTPSNQGDSAPDSGDTLTGTFFFQDYGFTDRFNGAFGDTTAVQVSLWGDSRNAAGNTGTRSDGGGSTADDLVGLDIVFEGVGDGTPVPEPATVALLGLGSLMLVRRRRA